MTKWEFSMINRDEYERVCKENRELKAELGWVTKQLSVNVCNKYKETRREC